MGGDGLRKKSSKRSLAQLIVFFFLMRVRDLFAEKKCKFDTFISGQ